MTHQQYALARSRAMGWKADAIPRRFCLRQGIPADLPTAATAVYIVDDLHSRLPLIARR